MSSFDSDPEDSKPSRSVNVVKLRGSENYAEWFDSIGSYLVEHGLWEYVKPLKAGVTSPVGRKNDVAWAAVMRSLSMTVKGNLSSEAASFDEPAPRKLWAELTETYSSACASEQAERLAFIWKTPLEESEDPIEWVSRLRAAHTDIQRSTPISSELMLCYAIIKGLPPSWDSVAASLWQQVLTPASVVAAIRAEVRRRKTSDGAGETAFRAQAVPEEWLCPIHRSNSHTLGKCEVAIDAVAKYGGHAKLAVSSDDELEAGYATAMIVKSGSTSPTLFHVDSGASDHMTCSKKFFESVREERRPIHVGGGTLWSTHVGVLKLSKKLIFKDVLLVPELGAHLLSVNKLLKAGYTVNFSDTVCTLMKGTSEIRAPFGKGVYSLEASSSPPSSALIATPSDALFDWHLRLGHLNFREVVRLGEAGELEGWKGCTTLELANASCVSCIVGKGRRLPTGPATDRVTAPNDLIHLDVWGPARTPSFSQSRYFLTVYDDHTCYVKIYPLKHKSDVLSRFRDFVNLAVTQQGCPIKRIRTDNGGEFTSNAFQAFLRDKGIIHNRVPPDAHSLNGRVERVHLTILNDVRTLLDSSGLPPVFWGEAALYSVHVRNCMPVAGRLPPYTAWSGRPVDLNHLKPFGRTVFVRDHVQSDKLAPRYKAVQLTGWSEDSMSSIKYYCPKSETFNYSRDVVYALPEQGGEVNTMLRRTSKSRKRMKKKKPAKVQLVPPVATPVAMAPPPSEPTESGTSTSSPVITPSATPEPEPPLAIPEPVDNSPSPPPEPVPELPNHPGWDWEVDSRYDRSRAPSPEPETTPQPVQQDPTNVVLRRSGRERNEPDRYGYNVSAAFIAHASALLADVANPRNYKQARHSGEWEKWKVAMDQELQKIEDYKVYKLVDRTPDMNVIHGRWVYTRKIDGETGKPSAYKARWCARGDTQVDGIHFNDTHSSVVHKDSIRVLLSLVNYFDMECDQVDVTAAFLNGDLEETIYMSPPEGSNIPSHKVLHLRKSLYGLRQSPRCFNKTFDEWMRQDGFVPTSADPCLYVRKTEKAVIFVSVHVDDQLVASNSRTELDAFKARLNSKFACTDNGPVNYFLGFNVMRDRKNKKLWISQEHYVESLLERFGMEDCKLPAKPSSATPLPSQFKPRVATDEEFESVKHLDYPQIAGSVLYLSTITRPDIAFAAGVLARYISKWNLDHYLAAKHLLRYLRATSDLCLVYDGEAGKRMLLGWADADWGACLDTRRSTTGYVFKTFGGLTSWRARRQPTVSLSTCEAEFKASSDAAKQNLWLRKLFNDIGFTLKEPTTLYNDNMGAILVSKNSTQHDRMKHVDMTYHNIREQVENKNIQLVHVPSKDNEADLLTKSLQATLFDTLRSLLGMARKSIRS